MPYRVIYFGPLGYSHVEPLGRPEDCKSPDELSHELASVDLRLMIGSRKGTLKNIPSKLSLNSPVRFYEPSKALDCP